AMVGGIIGAAIVGLVPGVGTVLAAGGLIGILGGGAIGAAAGGALGGLLGRGVPDQDIRFYEAELREGRALVTVQGIDRQRAETAADILARAGGRFAADVEDFGEEDEYLPEGSGFHRTGAIGSAGRTDTVSPVAPADVPEPEPISRGYRPEEDEVIPVGASPEYGPDTDLWSEGIEAAREEDRERFGGPEEGEPMPGVGVYTRVPGANPETAADIVPKTGSGVEWGHDPDAPPEEQPSRQRREGKRPEDLGVAASAEGAGTRRPEEVHRATPRDLEADEQLDRQERSDASSQHPGYDTGTTGVAADWRKPIGPTETPAQERAAADTGEGAPIETGDTGDVLEATEGGDLVVDEETAEYGTGTRDSLDEERRPPYEPVVDEGSVGALGERLGEETVRREGVAPRPADEDEEQDRG
ncbi:MAG: hypothetical protein IRY97_01510, partial [Thermomicrobiaceae bacterium]|nr:hypothetical protein [Thermomicrobiaceae bacterium]